jgi:exopolysaccharide biosynthesis polyprenyl glycosylphosphotransferase
MKHHHIGRKADHPRKYMGTSKFYIDLVELTLVSITYPLSIWLMKNFFLADFMVKTGVTLLFFAFILLSWFVVSRMTTLAKIPRTQRLLTLIFQYARFTFIAFIGLITFKILFRLTSIPVLLIVIYVTTMFMVTLLFRLITFKVVKVSRTFELNTSRVLIVADAFSDGIIQTLMIQKEWGFRIESIITDSRLIKAKYGPLFQIHPSGVNIKNVIDQGIVDEVIYCKRNVEIDLIREIADLCNEIGVIFRMQAFVSPLDPTDFQLKTFNNRKDLSIVDTPSSSLSVVLKNMTDIYFSILALIILIPLFISIAAVIKISSRGPIFFKQERIGRRGRKFNLYKFRTMVHHAEEQLKKLKDMNEADGPVFKIKNDPRITMIGRVLRSTGLDELPQLYNVMKGEMSLIGPRPPIEAEVDQYERWQLRRLSVKPGITCSWQIVPDRHDVPFEEWMELDLHYIDNWSLAKDLVLFIKTIRTFFRSGGH